LVVTYVHDSWHDGQSKALIHLLSLKTSAGSHDHFYKMASVDLEILGQLHAVSLSRVYFGRIRHCRC
jgi:hypothetical protein